MKEKNQGTDPTLPKLGTMEARKAVRGKIPRVLSQRPLPSRKNRNGNHHTVSKRITSSVKTKTGLPLRRHADRQQPPRYFVGIGASAGGLEALRGLFGALKSLDKMTVVVVQHLAPQHRSRLVEIIGHSTSIKVKEISDCELPLTHTIYITPPNADVVFQDGVLRLNPPEAKVGPKPSVDRFFSSLADEVGENVIGVILSGTGSDGAQGIRAIKAAGGVTISQSLESAKYDGMPRAAKQRVLSTWS